MCCDSFTISNDNKQEIYISFTLHLHLFNTSLCLQVWTKLLFIPDRGECQLLLTFKRVGIKRNKIIVSKKIQVAFQTPLSLFFLSLSVNLTDTHAKQQENAKHRYIWHSWVQHTDSKKKKKKKAFVWLHLKVQGGSQTSKYPVLFRGTTYQLSRSHFSFSSREYHDWSWSLKYTHTHIP